MSVVRLAFFDRSREQKDLPEMSSMQHPSCTSRHTVSCIHMMVPPEAGIPSSSRETLRSIHTVSNEQQMYRQHKHMCVGTFLRWP